MENEPKKSIGNKDLTSTVIVLYLVFIIFQIIGDLNSGSVSVTQVWIGIVVVITFWASWPWIAKQPARLYSDQHKRIIKIGDTLVTISVAVSIVLYFLLKH